MRQKLKATDPISVLIEVGDLVIGVMLEFIIHFSHHGYCVRPTVVHVKVIEYFLDVCRLEDDLFSMFDSNMYNEVPLEWLVCTFKLVQKCRDLCAQNILGIKQENEVVHVSQNYEDFPLFSLTED